MVRFAIAMIIAARHVGRWVAALAIVVIAHFRTGHLDALENVFQLLNQINPRDYIGL